MRKTHFSETASMDNLEPGTRLYGEAQVAEWEPSRGREVVNRGVGR
jgi:hypothetical protein